MIETRLIYRVLGMDEKMISKNDMEKYERKIKKKNLSMKNNGETQRNARFRKLLTIHCATDYRSVMHR